MNKSFYFGLFTAAALQSFQMHAGDMPLIEGKYAASWESLSQWECPEWFKDAKFGIWAHWGPQCEAEDGDWYARHMYYPGSGQYNWHVAHYDNPKNFGLKDLCNEWKAENWNPKELVELYKSVGARYFMVLANHHDNMDLWDSPYQEWNSTKIGPHRDIVGEWAEACREAGMHLGVSVHASHAWTWLEPSQAYDGTLTKEDGYTLNPDGTEKWWKGLDPQELYAQNHPHSTGWSNSGTIHSQWDWGNGASLPSDQYKQKLMNRTLQLVNDYAPDMIYFGDTVLPFYGCDDNWGTDFLSSYYNFSARRTGGDAEVVVTGKQLLPLHKKAMLWDVERGIPDRMQQEYWQTCTCIGDWHYSQATYNNNGYKSGATVIRMLMDVISKNGNLLLSVPVKGDGTIDEKERKILADIKAWMDVNSEAVYGTHVWKTFGEGPLADAANPMNAQGFNEGLNYTSSDIRFVEKNGVIYATVMSWPEAGEYTIKSFSPVSDYYSGNVTGVSLVGYGALPYRQDASGLTVTFPDEQLNQIAPVLAITTDNADISTAERLATMIDIVETFLTEVQTRGSYYNTGLFDLAQVAALQRELDSAKENENTEAAFRQLRQAYGTFTKDALIKGADIASTAMPGTDITTDSFGEASNFARTGSRTRFGKPEKWTVENFSIPQGSSGTKEGLDSYSGREALMLGIWNDRDRNQEGNLENARIYQKITLPKGLYFFGGAYNTTYNITSDAYMFVAAETLPTAEIPLKAMASRKIAECSENTNEFSGLYFLLPEETEIAIGWQADLAHGNDTQEFRVEKVALLQLEEISQADLDELRAAIKTFLGELERNNRINGNTGSFTRGDFDHMTEVLKSTDVPSSAADITSIYFPLKFEWERFLMSQNPFSAPQKEYAADLTTEKLIESANFTPAENTATRFATPKHWTVENFSIPNGEEGTKSGLDSYSNGYALMLGVWEDRNRNQEGSLENARIYRKIYLDKGEYYFGARYNALYNLHEAYTFVMPALTTTAAIPSGAIAHAKIGDAALDNEFYGLHFSVAEPGEYYLGWQADLLHGASCQEFRAEELMLLGNTDLSGVDECAVPDTPGIRICTDSVVTAVPTLISIYSITGAKVAETYGTSMDCSRLRGLYLVKAGTTVTKAIF